MNKDDILKNFDELINTAEILLTYLCDGSDNSGDKPMESITVMLLQLLDFFGNNRVTMEQIFPKMELIKNRINDKNYVGAIWDTKDLINSLREIRGLIANRS